MLAFPDWLEWNSSPGPRGTTVRPDLDTVLFSKAIDRRRVERQQYVRLMREDGERREVDGRCCRQRRVEVDLRHCSCGEENVLAEAVVPTSFSCEKQLQVYIANITAAPSPSASDTHGERRFAEAA